MNDQALQALVNQATHFSTHSGEVGEGGIFVALKGSARDAHDFVPELLKKGILAAFVERDFQDKRAHRVADTHAVHWKLAAMFRNKFKGTVIGVGGSSGKTSTKELLHKVLSTRFHCVKTEKSQNGLLGIPKTLEKLRDGIEVAIVEIGIDAPGEMARNVALVRPTHSLLTSIGEEHLLLLKDVANVFKEERILIDETLTWGGKGYCPLADPYLAQLTQAKLVPPTPQSVHPELNVSAQDKHTLQNMALTAAVALDLGLDPLKILEAFEDSEPLDGRGLKWQWADRVWVLRDHYNANPSSMGVALESAANFAQKKALPLKLILGDMRELGAASQNYHKDIIQRARALKPTQIVWVGEEMVAAVGSPLKGEYLLNTSECELSQDLLTQLKQDAVVLVKASRGTALEKLMDRIYGHHKGQ